MMEAANKEDSTHHRLFNAVLSSRTQKGAIRKVNHHFYQDRTASQEDRINQYYTENATTLTTSFGAYNDGKAPLQDCNIVTIHQ